MMVLNILRWFLCSFCILCIVPVFAVNSNDCEFYSTIVQLVDSGNSDDAEEKCSEVLKKEPSRADALLSQSYICQSKKDYYGAFRFYHKAHQSNINITSFCKYKPIRSQSSEPQAEISKLTSSINREPQNSELYFDMAVVCASFGMEKPALTNIDKAIAIDVSDFIFYLQRATINYQFNNFDDALIDLDKALKLKPVYPLIYMQFGDIYSNMGKQEMAVNSYNKAIEISPDFALGYFSRGKLFKSNGRNKDAIRDFQKVCEINANDWFAHNMICELHFSDKEYDDAIDEADMSIEIHEDNFYAYYLKGMVYSYKDELDTAISNFTKSIDLDPEFPGAYLARGISYANKGKYDLAKADFKTCLKLNPNDMEARRWIKKLPDSSGFVGPLVGIIVILLLAFFLHRSLKKNE